jgi:Predicted ester cyclase
MRQATIGIFLSIILGALPVAAAEDISAQEAKNKAIAARVFEEIFNQAKFQVADEIYAPDFVNHGLHRDATLQEDQNAVHAERKAFPDLKMTVNLMTAKDDLVTAVWTFRGTHTGSGLGLPPTGARIELRGITVWRIVNGKISEEWTSFNELRPYIQIATQLRWPIIGFLFALLAAVIIFERLFFKIIRIWLPKK